MGGKIKNVLDGVKFPVIIHTENGRILEINEEFLKRFGYSYQDFEDSKITQFPETRCLRKVQEKIGKLKEFETSSFQTFCREKDGEEFPVKIVSSKIDYLGKHAYLTVIQEVTEVRKTEKKLLRSEWEKSIILDSMNELVFLQDEKGKIEWANKAVAEKLGFNNRTEVEGEYCYEIAQERGARCPECPTKKVIEDKKPYKGEVQTPNGKIWFVNHYPIIGPDGEIESILAIEQDITDRKETERRNKFLNSVIRQDLKTKQQFLMGNLQLMEESLDIEDEEERLFYKSFDVAKEAEEMIRLLERLRKIENSKWEMEKDLGKSLENSIRQLREEVDSENLEIKNSRPEEVEKVIADYSLETLFLQIMKGRIELNNAESLEIRVKDLDDECKVEILDDGEAFPKDMRNLFSGKVYSGETTGVGGAKWYLVRRIAECNNAEIEPEVQKDGRNVINLIFRKS